VNADVTLAGHLESQVNLAKWDTQITLPDQGTDENPQSLQDPDRDGTQEIGNPTFNYSVTANGQITAHVKPTITFGLDFNSNFLNVGSAKVDLVADGSLQVYANAATSNSGSGSSFCYGAIAAASLYATVEAPSVFGWDFNVPQYQIAPVISKDVIPQTCPIGSRDLDIMDGYYISERSSSPDVYISRAKAKRSTVIGPLLHLNSGLTCPQSDNNVSGNVSSCPLCDDESSSELQLSGRDSACYIVQSGGETFCPADLSSRGLDDLYYDGNFTVLESRALNSKTIQWTASGSTNGADGTYALDCGTYPTCGSAKTVTNIDKWFGFPPENEPCTNAVAQRPGRDVDSSKFVSKYELYGFLRTAS
jgi:chitinase